MYSSAVWEYIPQLDFQIILLTVRVTVTYTRNDREKLMHNTYSEALSWPLSTGGLHAGTQCTVNVNWNNTECTVLQLVLHSQDRQWYPHLHNKTYSTWKWKYNEHISFWRCCSFMTTSMKTTSLNSVITLLWLQRQSITVTLVFRVYYTTIPKSLLLGTAGVVKFRVMWSEMFL